MTDTFWCHAVWVDFFSRKAAKWTDIEYFISRFEGILQFNNHAGMERVHALVNKNNPEGTDRNRLDVE